MAPIANVNIASPEFKADPFPFYARLRSEAPVYRTTLPDKRNAWLVTRYQDVAALLKDDRFSKDKLYAQDLPWIPGMFKPLMRNMLDLDAPDHTRLRGVVQKAFMPRLIENLWQRIQALADELLNRVQSQGRMDLIHDCGGRGVLWEFNRFLPEKPCQTGTLVKRLLLMLIDVWFSQPCESSYLRRHLPFKSAVPTLVSMHAVASAARAASFSRANVK